jgi:hypothetical protein
VSIDAEADFLIKLRDAVAMILDAYQERLERRQHDQRPEAWTDKVWSWNPNKIQWIVTPGPNGNYDKSTDFDNIEHKNLVKDLSGHDGKLTRDDSFYWLFDSDNRTVGRKPKK